MCKLTCILAAAFLLLAVEAGAQQLTVSASGYVPLGIDDLDGSLPLMTEIRVTIPVSERYAVEPFVSIGPRSRSGWPSTEGFAGAQVRQRLTGGADSNVFATYGASLYYPADALIPIGHFGAGLERRLWRRLTLRPEVQLVTFHVIPVGVRLLAGVSIELGR